jgi:hypothetical protein
VRLADNGIAADPAKLFGNLACRGSAFPHFGQPIDAFVSPAHQISILLQ